LCALLPYVFYLRSYYLMGGKYIYKKQQLLNK
jgi:hypothetical protein